MLNNIRLEDVLFLDIETAPLVYKYEDLEESKQILWDQKFQHTPAEQKSDLYKKAGIYAEFSKVICISVGVVKNKTLHLKSFYGDDEKDLLSRFIELLKTKHNRDTSLLCAHNGKEFDFPYICRRSLINGLKLPSILDIAGKKPWEVKHLDTMELWKFGDYKSYTSLNLLASVFGISTPKDDINGADVARVYWEEKNLLRIVTYCQKDVLTLVQLFLRFKGEALIDENNVNIVSE